MSSIYDVLELIEDLVSWSVAVGVYLIENHFFLFLHLIFREDAVEHHVSEEVHSLADMFFEERGVDTCLLLGSECVKVAANVFQTAEDMIRLAMFRPFKDKVLDKMGETILVLKLVTHPHVHHESYM